MDQTTDNVALYEEEGLWSPTYTANPYYRTKIKLIGGMIPDDTNTILDVGCGNGAIANSLNTDYWVVGGDRSWKALKYVLGRSLRLSAERLPFKDRSFDLVMTHQVLEHLPNDIFQGALSEIMRVTKRYLLISVPYKDPLAEDYARCLNCKCVYNVFGHLRRFKSVAELRKLFPSFGLRVHAFCGRENRYMNRLALWISQRIGGGWTTEPNAVCPKCGSRNQFQAGFPRRIVSSLVHRLDRLIPKGTMFWWTVCLFERLDRPEGIRSTDRRQES